MKELSFDTWLAQTKKDYVVAFLRDWVSDRVNKDMTKDRIARVLDSYGLIDKAEKEINRVRSLKGMYKADFYKYGPWIRGGR